MADWQGRDLRKEILRSRAAGAMTEALGEIALRIARAKLKRWGIGGHAAQETVSMFLVQFCARWRSIRPHGPQAYSYLCRMLWSAAGENAKQTRRERRRKARLLRDVERAALGCPEAFEDCMAGGSDNAPD